MLANLCDVLPGLTRVSRDAVIARPSGRLVEGTAAESLVHLSNQTSTEILGQPFLAVSLIHLMSRFVSMTNISVSHTKLIGIFMHFPSPLEACYFLRAWGLCTLVAKSA